MADLFKCDRCGHVGPLMHKRGRFIVQELNVHDGNPHSSLYNGRAEVCYTCLEALIASLGGRKSGAADMTKNLEVMRAANESPSGTIRAIGEGT